MAYCNVSHYSPYHAVIFILTFFSYSCLHAVRKAFSNVKPTILEEWTPTFHNSSIPELYPLKTWNARFVFESHTTAETYLGTLDMVFMFSYAFGLFVSGYVAERLNHRWVLSMGMMSSSIIVFIFGVVTQWFHFYNIYFYCGVWILNGLCQSTGWPTAVAIMGSWFGENKGLIFGIWSACASVGNIIGALLCGAVIDYGYEYGFLVPSALLFSGGLIVACGIVNHPEEIGIFEEKEDSEEVADETHSLNNTDNTFYGSVDNNVSDEYGRNGSNIHEEPVEEVAVVNANAIGFCKAFAIPGVVPYALAYACLKLVNYSFFFWLPTYLNGNYGWSNAFSDDLSTYYDFGGIVGGIVAGVISDFLWARSPVTAGFLWISVPVLYLYSRSPANEVVNAILMWLTGFFIGGPANVISATIMADLGSNKDVSGNKEAFAIITGIVDGTGSVGAAVGQIAVPILQEAFNWNTIFYLFMLLDFLTTVCISPVLYKDIKRKFF